MSTVKIIIAIVAATVVSSIFDLIFDVFNRKDKKLDLKKRLWLGWISLFIFLTVMDLVLLFMGNSWEWYDVPLNIGICTVAILVEFAILWMIRTGKRRKENRSR